MVMTPNEEDGLKMGRIVDMLAGEPIEKITRGLTEVALSIFKASGVDLVKVFL
jgi:hypothetical protein